MISILIPTYNYDSSELILTLQKQGEALALPYEIIVADDASTTPPLWASHVQELPHVQMLLLKENHGRSAIRNLLAERALYPYLLFIDGDAAVCSEQFLENYVRRLEPNSILVGGTAYQAENHNKTYALRLTYGRKREANSDYNRYFTTFNFVIPKNLFQQVRFDTSITGYGHEDLIFGLSLEKLPIKFVYINNPLLHMGLEPSSSFISKTEQANSNLLKLYADGHYPELLEHSKLLSLYVKLQHYHLQGAASFCFRLFRPLLYKQLTGAHPSLFLFDVYKIGQLCNR